MRFRDFSSYAHQELAVTLTNHFSWLYDAFISFFSLCAQVVNEDVDDSSVVSALAALGMSLSTTSLFADSSYLPVTLNGNVLGRVHETQLVELSTALRTLKAKGLRGASRAAPHSPSSRFVAMEPHPSPPKTGCTTSSSRLDSARRRFPSGLRSVPSPSRRSTLACTPASTSSPASPA